MTASPHIMVFDSGAGGLSIAKTLLQTAPHAFKLSYLADRSAFPYGNKDASFLISHISNLIGNFIQAQRPDLIVIACNTASTIVLPTLREQFSCPFVGVVPAIKPAAALSQTRCIGVLATPATVKREYTSALINEFAGDCEVILYGSDKLVRCAESFISDTVLDEQLIAGEISQLLAQQTDKRIDTVVLACTHFPLIAGPLALAAPQVTHWVDSGNAIARRAFHLLEDVSSGSFTEEIRRKAENNVHISFSSDSIQEANINNLQSAYTRYLFSKS